MNKRCRFPFFFKTQISIFFSVTISIPQFYWVTRYNACVRISGFCGDANRCEIEAIIRAANAFHARHYESPRITRGLAESAADVRFTGSDVSSVEHVNRGTAIQGKIYADPVYESMTPTCLCFSSLSSVVTPRISRAGRSLASIDSLLFHIANDASPRLSSIFSNKRLTSFISKQTIPRDRILILICEANLRNI